MDDISNSRSSITKTIKEQKEEFVTGHNGTTSQEVFSLLLSGPIGMILFITAHSIIVKPYNKKDKKILRILLEYIFVIIPMCICETRYLYPTIYYMITFCFLSLPYYFLQVEKNNITRIKEISKNKVEYISWYRSLIMIYTIIAILAVDFHIFPRKYAKVEISGYSLMDLGASSSIISSAIVSSYAKYGVVTTKRSSYSVCALFIIGIIRTVVLLCIDYQGHDSEYGIHWNFFLTLFILDVLSNPIRKCVMSNQYRILQIIVVCILYQFILSYKIHDFIVHAPRTCSNDDHSYGFLILCNFFYANREGVIGCIGYLLLYYLTQEIAHSCIWSFNTKSQNPASFSTGTKYILLSTILWSIHSFITSYTTIPISRRSTNVPFIIWTLAINMTLLTILHFILHLLRKFNDNLSFHILSSINKNGFVIFMIANLFTGIINLCIDTLRVDDVFAFGIILLYVTLLIGVALWIQ